MAEDEDEILDYPEEDYNDDNENVDMTDENVIGGKYEFLTMDEMGKERQKKIEEFIPYSNLTNAQAELVLMNYNWNIDVLMNDWYDKMQKIKENSGISQTKESQKKLKWKLSLGNVCVSNAIINSVLIALENILKKKQMIN